MANKHSFKGKKKHKKEKSRKHKKEKKCKNQKKDKSKHKSKSTVSSCSDSETTLIDAKVKSSNRAEWGFLETVLNDSNVSLKNKKEKAKRPSPEMPGQNVRELNPYWKDGGNGLPPSVSEKIRNMESTSNNKFSSSSHRENCFSGNKTYNTVNLTYDKQSEPKFLKPDEECNFSFNVTNHQRNWKKKKPEELNTEMVVQEENNKNKKVSSETNSFSNEELNKLASKLVKAEIMGNINLVNKLKVELEAAKKAKMECKEKNEVVILTDRNTKKSYDSQKNYSPLKRQKINTHDSTGRVCYFPDDDKYSLKNLFENEKRVSEKEILLPSKLAAKNQDDLDDIYLEAASSNKMQQKIEERKNQKAQKEAVVKHKTLEGCRWCLDNRNETKHLIVSTGSKCYICLPEEESLSSGHCLIVPLQHEVSTMHLDEDVWSEIKAYQKALTQMFLEKEQDIVFFENARSFKRFPHCFIQCVPLSKEMGDVAPIYFQKAISESETEWSNNKKIIDFRQKDLRRVLPKGLPYFAISFGTGGGFAHIIEDEYLFKRNFAEEVLGGMLDLDPQIWRKPRKENFRSQREKALEFLKIWKKFEFNENSEDSESSSSD